MGFLWLHPNDTHYFKQTMKKSRNTNLNIVISSDLQVERGLEWNLILRDCLNVDLLDEAVVGHNLVPVHHIYQGFSEGHLPDSRHVKAIHIVPPVDLVVLVLPVLYGTDVESCSKITKGQSSLLPNLLDKYRECNNYTVASPKEA